MGVGWGRTRPHSGSSDKGGEEELEPHSSAYRRASQRSPAQHPKASSSSSPLRSLPEFTMWFPVLLGQAQCGLRAPPNLPSGRIIWASGLLTVTLLSEEKETPPNFGRTSRGLQSSVLPAGADSRHCSYLLKKVIPGGPQFHKKCPSFPI